MKFTPIDWNIYNRPPYYPEYLARGETKKLVSFDDEGLAEIDKNIDKAADQYDLDTVKAVLLDRIGKIVDEKRDGNEDELYRLLIRLRILLNTASGTVNDIIKVVKFIYSSEVVHIIPGYPAGITILHDGESPSVNFNKYIVQVIGAGIAYDTRDLFEFSDLVEVSESLNVKVRRSDFDTFGHPIKHNGAIKRDGHTVNDTVLVKNKHDGTFKHNGAIKHNGFRTVKNLSRPEPPFKHGYSSSISDTLSLLTCRPGAYTDTVSMEEETSMGMIKHHKHNGVYKHNGAIKHDSGIFFPLA
ncbi:MAG: DUF2612 domain-containing protein [Treponema sp.]|jgi:hypothetical protein|nr:DUF2612 domain-containing protein [Treponema sp.]